MTISKVYGVLPAFIFHGKWFKQIPLYRNADGITIGNVIIIDTSKHTGYDVILAHEKVHVEQFYRYLGINGLMYLSSSGRLMLELEAYCRTYPESSTKKYVIASKLINNYSLKYTYGAVVKAVDIAMEKYHEKKTM